MVWGYITRSSSKLGHTVLTLLVHSWDVPDPLCQPVDLTNQSDLSNYKHNHRVNYFEVLWNSQTLYTIGNSLIVGKVKVSIGLVVALLGLLLHMVLVAYAPTNFLIAKHINWHLTETLSGNVCLVV
jgi:hypothetical protein